MDGFDEIKGNRNLYETNKLNEWNAFVVITCRAEFLAGKNYVSLFQSSSSAAPLKEFYIATFEENQRLKYWTKLLQFNPSIPFKSPEEFQSSVKEVPGLNELITTPFMLTLVSQVLPRLKELGRKITRSDLYEEFTNDWFSRQRDKIYSSLVFFHFSFRFDLLTTLNN